MPGSTPAFGLPYPLSTDPISDGDDVIQALAEQLDDILGAARAIARVKCPGGTVGALDSQIPLNLDYQVGDPGAYTIGGNRILPTQAGIYLCTAEFSMLPSAGAHVFGYIWYGANLSTYTKISNGAIPVDQGALSITTVYRFTGTPTTGLALGVNISAGGSATLAADGGPVPFGLTVARLF